MHLIVIMMVLLASCVFQSPAAADEADVQERIRQLTEKIEKEPQKFGPWFSRAWLYHSTDDFKPARRDLLEAARLSKHPLMLNNIAWALVSSHHDKFRDGMLALDLALEANRQTRFANPMYLDTLAAAYALSGNFRAAIRWQQAAINILEKNPKGSQNTLRLARKHLQAYRNSKTLTDAQ